MGSLDKYLNELFWEKEEKIDPNLPNPYNFRALKLDPNVTSSDWKKAQVEWSKRPLMNGSEVDVKKAFLNPPEGYNDGIAWVIIDNEQRVGVVGIQNLLGDKKIIHGGNIVYVTWVHGKKYAARGVMKMLELPIFDQKDSLMSLSISMKNKFSIQVAKDLKAKQRYISREENKIGYLIKAPWWWSKPKK